MSAPDLDERDVEAVAEVVRSGRLSLGPRCEEFERRVAEYVGVGHAVAVSSGTAGLHTLVRALGLGPGDDVLVPSFTFVASVNALLFEGVRPVFVDIRPDTYNLDPEELEFRRTPRTRGIMAVDVFGHPVDWNAVEAFAREHGLRVIDDSCEALGASYAGRRVGSFGDAATFAFYPNKQITTGEGGIVVTDDREIAETVRSLRNQGRGRMGAWLKHERLGFNYRLNEMSAALGVTQMERLDEILARRAEVAAIYRDRLRSVEGLRRPVVRNGVTMSWFVYVITLAQDLERDAVIRALDRRGIPSRGYFSPVHLQPYLRKREEIEKPELPVTEAAARRTLALPFHARLSRAEIDRVVDALAETIHELRG